MSQHCVLTCDEDEVSEMDMSPNEWRGENTHIHNKGL
jgi:hypothetical protein